MSRPLRLEFPGALYHVTARGNAQGDIFLNDGDRALLLACLSETVKRFGWLCHAYCLMDNHYHLLIETPDGNLSQGMRQLNGVYTQRFNRQHQRVGHLLQGRYKAILVERDSYLLELCRYVVLNPIRARMVKHIERYPWSSYPASMGMTACPGWLSTDWLLGHFDQRRSVARKHYAEFVAQGIGLASPWAAVQGQVLLGAETFAEKMRPLLEGKKELTEIPRSQRLLHRPSLKKLFTKDVPGDKVMRDKAIRQAYGECGYSMAAIAKHAEVHYSTVSKIIKGER
jgi:REP element-mobilizing transposase RayT